MEERIERPTKAVSVALEYLRWLTRALMIVKPWRLETEYDPANAFTVSTVYTEGVDDTWHRWMKELRATFTAEWNEQDEGERRDGLRLNACIGNPARVILEAIRFLDWLTGTVDENEKFRIVLEHDPEAPNAVISVTKQAGGSDQKEEAAPL